MNTLVRFLIDCRPLAMSMGNAIRYLKMTISKLPPSLPEDRAKDMLQSSISAYIRERIQFADEVICSLAVSKINNGDVIMTYGKSHVVEMLLKKVYAIARSFGVVMLASTLLCVSRHMKKRNNFE